MSKVTIQPRFEPDGDCKKVALDFALYFLKGNYANAGQINSLKQLNSILSFLDANQFSFLLALSPIGMLRYWLLKLKFGAKITLSRSYRKKKKELIAQQKNYVAVLEQSAIKLYGLKNESWTHFVVFYKDLGNDLQGVYDPLRPALEKEYKKELKKFEDLDEEEMDRITLVKLLIWN